MTAIGPHLPQYLRTTLLLVIFLVLIVTIWSQKFLSIDSNDLKKKEYIPSVYEAQPIVFNKIDKCYKSPNEDSVISYFEDILDAKKQPKIGKAIFFHETTCSRTGIFNLNAK